MKYKRKTKRILLISDDLNKENFESLKELIKDGNYYYSEEDNIFIFEIEWVEDFEDIRDKPYLRKFDVFLIDYGLVGDDEDNLEMIRDMFVNSKVAWCGGLNGKYCQDAKVLFPKRKYLHNLMETSLDYEQILFTLYKLLEEKKD